jgi:hypothetical protein
MRSAHVAMLVAVVAVALLVGRWASAQAVAVTPVTPTVLSGDDVGFRVEGHRNGRAVGTVVVRVNGQWVPVDQAGAISPLR